jgi:DNA-directed RNA polymerase alpha subunit
MTLEQLSKYSENEILKFHGMGKSAIPKLQKALEDKGLSLKKN